MVDGYEVRDLEITRELLATSKHGEVFLKIARDGLVRYVRISSIPDGWAGVAAFYKYAMLVPFHEIADDLLTSSVDGGFSSVDDPDSFHLESGADYKDIHAGYRSLRFDYFQIEQIDPTIPRKGRIAIHYCPPTDDDSDEVAEAELAIQFEIEYPSVARFLSNRHPEKWLSEFYDELEAAGDSFFAAMVFARYARDDTWKIGLPRRVSCGMSKSDGTAFINALARDPIMYLMRDRFGNGASKLMLEWAHGIQEKALNVSDVLSHFDMTEISSDMKRLLAHDDFGV